MKAKRYNTGKAEMHYLHTWRLALQEVCQVCMEGAEKYERGNYLRGQGYSELLSAAERHIFAFGDPAIPDVDAESGRDHLAHAIWNLLQLLELKLTKGDLLFDDRIVPPCASTPEPPDPMDVPMNAGNLSDDEWHAVAGQERQKNRTKSVEPTPFDPTEVDEPEHYPSLDESANGITFEDFNPRRDK